MSIEPLAHYSYDTYLQLERESDEKYEYHDGVITNISGEVIDPGLILKNISFIYKLEKQVSKNLAYQRRKTFSTTSDHRFIVINAASVLNHQIRTFKKPYAIYNSDIKIWIEATERTICPDFSIVFGAPTYSGVDPQAITNPILVVEVCSQSSAAFDKGEKFFHYRQLPSLQQYVLIDQTSPIVDTFYRKSSGFWEIDTQMGLASIATLKAIGCELPLKEVYYRVPGIDPDMETS